MSVRQISGFGLVGRIGQRANLFAPDVLDRRPISDSEQAGDLNLWTAVHDDHQASRFSSPCRCVVANAQLHPDEADPKSLSQ
jgi:hypothetical protein